MPICGRRWGKTAVGLMALLMGHGPTPGYLPGAYDGGTYWWVAPSLPQIRTSKIWRHLKRATRGAAREAYGGRTSEMEKEIILENGATIAVKSADSGSSLRGDGITGMVVDEFPFLKEETWLEELRPSLVDTGGWAMLIGTPNGKNFAHKMFLEAKDRPDWESWQLPSSQNPLIPRSELEAALYDMGPRRFSQEHEARFQDVEGAIFPGSYFEDHIWADRWPEAFDVSAMFCDPSLGGKARAGDFSAIAFVGLSGGKFWVKMDLARRPPVQLVADLYGLYEQLRPDVCGIEANAFQAVLQPLSDQWCQINQKPPLPLWLITHGAGARGGDPKVRIQKLDAHLANQHILFWRSDSAEKTVEQLQMFPDTGYHDDGPDALEGAIDLMNRFVASQTEDQGYDYAGV